MTFPWEKLDPELDSIYSDYLKITSGSSDKTARLQNLNNIHPVLDDCEGLFLSLQYEGDLNEIEALGFETTTRESENVVNGYLSFDNFEKVASHSGVIALIYGDEMEPDLDLSIPDIKANQVRSVNHSTGQVTGAATGSGVIIGIIDSGIDIRHPVFLKAGAPNPTTRILRIWDQGLIPEGGESSPDASNLSGDIKPPYGVQYTNDHINKTLRKESGLKVRHRDCIGHGTHVAAIAAGSGDPGTHYNYVGVAPEADLIIVKYLSLEKNRSLNSEFRFKDAVTYILKMAREVLEGHPRPVVINSSFGSHLGPHDGLTKMEIFLNNTFKPGGAANSYWNGCAYVNSSGNDGEYSPNIKSKKRNHAVITVPQNKEVEVPFLMYDSRGTVRTNRYRCCEFDNTRELKLDLWYKNIENDTIKASVHLPGEPESKWEGPVVRHSTVDQYEKFPGKFGDHDQYGFTLQHGSKTAKRPGVAGSVVRNHIQLKITADGDRHTDGVIYKLKLKHSGAMNTEVEIHVWCQRATKHGFKLDKVLPNEVEIKNENLIASAKGAINTITVASSKDADDKLKDTSSRGPLTDYSGLGPIADKPDITAPGYKILSSRSRDERSVLSIPGRVAQYIEKGGTSMAAPHVTGAVALMFQKNNNLSPTDIKRILMEPTNVRNGADPAPGDPEYVIGYGSGLLDVKESFDDV